MKAYKFEIITLGDCAFEDMVYDLQNQRYFSSSIISAQSTEIGEWYDDHPLNKKSETDQYVKNATWVPEEFEV